MQGADIREEPSTYILDIEYDNINVRDLLRCGLVVLAIQGNDLDTRLRINTILNGLTSICCTAETMLGPKYFYEIHSPRFQRINQVLAAGPGRVVHHEGNSLTREFRQQQVKLVSAGQ